MADVHLETVLSYYSDPQLSGRIESLGGAGGFSGARFWKIHTTTGPLCLRCWPTEHPSAGNLAAIHQVLGHVAAKGFDLVPVAIPTHDGASFVGHGGHLWELTPWLPGRADFHQQPSEVRLAAAMQALARFHQAASDCQVGRLDRHGPPPGVAQRLDRLTQIMVVGVKRLGLLLQSGPAHELEPLCRRIIDRFAGGATAVQKQLEPLRAVSIALQWCIGDVWCEHILFEGDRVSGLVDFGAMRWDNVATDVARLLGSLAGNDQLSWTKGLAAYQSVRALDDVETTLMRAYDRSGVLLAGLNWIEWIYGQGRTFDEWDRVRQRIEAILLRMEVVEM